MRMNNNPDLHPILKRGLLILTKEVRDMFGKAKNTEDLKNAIQDARNYLAYIFILAMREKPAEPAPNIRSFEEMVVSPHAKEPKGREILCLK